MTFCGQALPFLVWRTVVQVLGCSLPVEKLFWLTLRRHKVDPAVIRAYAAPFPSTAHRAGAARWPLLVPLFSDSPVTPHMTAARNCLKTWRKPALVMFSDNDPITRGQESLFLNLLPNAKQQIVEGAGHFLQETHGKLLAQNIITFLNE